MVLKLATKGVPSFFLKLLYHMIRGYDIIFFGSPYLCNNLNIHYMSPLFNDVYEGCAPRVRERKY